MRVVVVVVRRWRSEEERERAARRKSRDAHTQRYAQHTPVLPYRPPSQGARRGCGYFVFRGGRRASVGPRAARAAAAA